MENVALYYIIFGRNYFTVVLLYIFLFDKKQKDQHY